MLTELNLQKFLSDPIIRYNDNDKNDSMVKNGLSCANRAEMREFGMKCECERDEWRHKNGSFSICDFHSFMRDNSSLKFEM